MNYPFVRYKKDIFSAEEMSKRSKEFYDWMNQRRTVRDFSNQPVPADVIQNMIMTASTAPSGAHKQPWTFCAVSNAEIKKQIRYAAEEEERTNYDGRMSAEWLEDLAPLQTDWHKEFLETAPWLIIVFKHSYQIDRGRKRNTYYAVESVGIACGFLLSAVHHAGLVALTHTPSPMNFLCEILKRPENEKPFLLIPVGYPAEKVMVPELTRKNAGEVMAFFE